MSKQPVDQIARIEGIPFADGYYWYYKRGKPLPSLVLVGDRDEQRVFKDGPAVCKTWWPGEFFVGPIAPPFPTPDHLALNPRGIDEEPISMELAAGLLLPDGAAS
ncbi:hypothetical protein QZM64_39975 [Burkholderia cepacia]|uniref:hypothetical protein n=1 Tax=Burkholderia cepacia complex TaxID=87882 RepID=UPI000CFE6D00|nr:MULTISPECIES: hypothetical protein [Burkholderia cepacia complex]MDN7445350.1 hypothetical protein [Burkholderia cepacia]PRD92221.1 hypothetical protein C6P88_16310 [Burkholderia contaminans]